MLALRRARSTPPRARSRRLAYFIDNASFKVNVSTACVVTGRIDADHGSRALINPANSALAGTSRAYFPRGGPVPPPPPRGIDETSSIGWGGMDAGANMLYPAQVVDGLTHLHAGPKLRDALAALPADATGQRCAVGAAVLSAPFGLHERFDAIAHTPTPFWPDVTHGEAAKAWRQSLRACYRSSVFAIAEQAPHGRVVWSDEAPRGEKAASGSSGLDDPCKWTHVACPLLGAGAAGAPTAVAAEVAMRTLAELAAEARSRRWQPLSVHLVLADEDAMRAISRLICLMRQMAPGM